MVERTYFFEIKADPSKLVKEINRTRDRLGKARATHLRVVRAEDEYRRALNKDENRRRAHWRKHAGRPRSRNRRGRRRR